MDSESKVIAVANTAQPIIENNWLLATLLITMVSAFIVVIIMLFKIIIKRNEERHLQNEIKSKELQEEIEIRRIESEKRHKDAEKQIELLSLLVQRHDVKIENLEKRVK